MTRRCKLKSSLEKLGAALCAALLIPVSIQAEPVTLHSGQGLDLTGDVLSFDGEYLRFATENYGILTLDYSGVTCEGLRCPDPNGPALLRFAGSARIGEVLLPALLEAYGRRQNLPVQSVDQISALQYLLGPVGEPLLKVDFSLTSSTQGFERLAGGIADVAMSDRPITGAELTALSETDRGNLENRTRILALDALVPVTSPAQQVESISLDNLAAVYRGEITDWADLGGAEMDIHPVLPRGDGEEQVGLERILLSDTQGRADIVEAPADADMAGLIMTDPGALGVLPIGSIGAASAMVIQDVCGLRAVPRRTALKTGDYPLTVPLYLYLPSYRLSPIARDFLSWLHSNEAQAVIRRAGFVDQGAVPIGIDVQGERLFNAVLLAGDEVPITELQNMLRDLDGKARLSPTFRFAEGATELTAVSQSNLMFLARAIRDGQYDGRRLSLIGFSDGSGPAAVNKELSLDRANSVLGELVAALGGELPDTVTVNTLGFGEAMPMGCDETVWGRRMNRRVELWIEN